MAPFLLEPVLNNNFPIAFDVVFGRLCGKIEGCVDGWPLTHAPANWLQPTTNEYISLNLKEKSCNYDAVGVQIREAMTGLAVCISLIMDWMKNALSEAFSSAANFFDLPFERKNHYYRLSTKSQGYSELGREKLEEADITEIKESFDVQRLPENYFEKKDLEIIPNFQKDISNLSQATKELALRILVCMAKVLNINDSQEFLDLHSNIFVKENGSTIRFLHYPAKEGISDETERVVRCATHTDYGGMTLLFQDEVGGLQVQNLKQEWMDVPPLPGMIFVNIGDLMEFWSGGKFRATPHRVLGNKFETARYSMAIFIHPNDKTQIDPIDGVDEKSSLCGITAGEYLIRRLRETYERTSS
ncbi:unnamed protein product [Lepeophtheirus salmonis]|uniref:(salmon louse) hypothetical protein n=1 Tax=Lepeophtheirus salmonis TaxID=72036 RepID=A0A7R8H436_LEPSM|nr:unnamed protein product [Lepeophtheirus salmonis]CAF2841535.1 unnamed protein product [Lepeophtheirus salmonis]